jgi:hypothetical protein
MNGLSALITDFTVRLAAALEREASERARASVLAAFSKGLGAQPKRRGRPPKALGASAGALVGKKPRKKVPIQLCPVPGCKNPAAPIFGMVCAKHKDLPKAKIKKYREARRAAKNGVSAKAPAPTKRRGRKAAPMKAKRLSPRRKAKPAAAPAATPTAAASSS